MSIRRLSLELDLDSSKFTASMRTAAGTTELFQKSVDSTSRSVKNIEKSVAGAGARFKDLTVTLAAARYAIDNVRLYLFSWVGALVRTSAEIERTTFLLSGLSKEMTQVGRAKEAANNLKYIIDLAKNAPFSINALSTAFVKLKSGGIDPTNGSLKALVNAVSAFGGSEQALDRAAIAIQQMSGKGVVSMEELRQQLGEAVPNAMALMAQGMGLSMAELTQKVSTGTVEAKTALEKMLAMFELTYGGASQRMMETFNGKVSQAKTGLMEFAMVATGLKADGSAQAGGFFMTLKDSLDDFIFALQSPALKSFGVDLGNGLTTAANGLRFFVESMSKLNSVVPLVTLLKNAFMMLAAVMTVNLARSAVAAMIGALAASRAALGATSAAVKLAAADFNVMTFAIRTANASTGQWAATAAIAGTAARTMGIAIASALGPISLIAMGIYTAANAFGFFENKAKRAQKALEDFKNTGVATEETIKATDDRIKEANKDLNTVQAQLDNAGKNHWSDTLIKNTEKRKAAIEAEVKTLEALKRAQVSTFATDNGRQVGNTWTRDINRRPEFNQIAQERLQARKGYDDVWGDKKKTEAERIAARETWIEANRKLDEREQGILSRSITLAERARDANAKGSEAWASHNQNLENLIEQRKQITERNGAGGGYEKILGENQFVATKKKGDGGVKSAVDAAESKLQTLRSQAAALSATIENDGEKGASELAKLMSQLDAKNGDEGLLKAVGASSELRSQLIAAATALDDLKAKMDGLKAFNGLTEERDKQQKTVEGLREELNAIFNKTQETIQVNARYRAGLEDNVKAAKAYNSEADKVADQAAEAQRTAQQMDAAKKAALDLSREVLSMQQQADDAFGEMSDGAGTSNMAMLRYQKTMEKMVLGVMPEFRDQARALADEAIAAFGRVQTAQAQNDMREETAAINRDLLTDRVQAQREALEQEIRLMYNRIQWDKLTAEERKKVEADYWAYVEAQRRKFAKDGGSPLRKMAAEWSNVTENMKQASAGWMDSFVDQLVEGKLNFADFTKAILADVLKIILRAIIAQMILAAIGAVTTGPVAPVPTVGTEGAISGISGSIASDFRPSSLPVPKFHTGGIVDMFAEAYKYHTGGIAGLKPNEVPAILEHGEGVFTKEQMAAMGNRQVPNVTVQVINESGTKMDAQQSGGRFDGEGYIIGVVIDAASKPGKMRDALRGASR